MPHSLDEGIGKRIRADRLAGSDGESSNKCSCCSRCLKKNGRRVEWCKSRARRCLPRALQPWCKDSPELQPSTVMLVKRRDEFGADASSAVGGHIRHTRAHIDDAVHRLRGEFETAQRVMAEQMAAQMDARLGELKAEVAVQLNETRQLRETVTSRMDAMIVAMRPLREMAFAQDGSIDV